MERVNVRDLRNHGGDVLNRVIAGQEIVVERSGTPVARLLPMGSQRLDARALVERRRPLLAIDLARFRHDVDNAVDLEL